MSSVGLESSQLEFQCPFCERKRLKKTKVLGQPGIVSANCDICGAFITSEYFLGYPHNKQEWWDSRHLLSGLLREKTIYGESPPRIEFDTIPKLLEEESDRIPQAEEKGERLLRLLSVQFPKRGEPIHLDRIRYRPLCYGEDVNEFRYYVEELIEKDFIQSLYSDNSSVKITSRGWSFLRSHLKEVHSQQDVISPTNNGEESKLITTTFKDSFYNDLRDEINAAFQAELFTASMVLLRKLTENLAIDILREKFPQSQHGNLELYYIRSQGKHQNFATLLENLNKKKTDFGADKDAVSEFVAKATRCKHQGNSTAHSILIVSYKNDGVN